MNHWRNEALSKIFFFLIAGLRLIRLKDEGKLIKYVDIWSLFVSLWSKFWNAAIRLDFSSQWIPGQERAPPGKGWWPGHVGEWLATVHSSSPEAALIRGTHDRIRKSPPPCTTLNGVPVIPLTSWPGSFHGVAKKTRGFADSTSTAHFPLTCLLST